MLITFACPECSAELEVNATAAGSQVTCPHCQQTIQVPKMGPGPGVTIGQFQIQELIGKGGMGEVYLARQLSLGRDIALKILPERLRGQKARVQRFLNEVQALARLDHPNIVIAHEAGEDNDILYLAMSYVAGQSLEAYLRKNGPMAEQQALQMVDKLADALDYAWREHHLLHRDIKPANILLTAGGEVKLTDFGLAKCLDSATELTMSGDLIGSPNYMSPEQINGEMDIDYRSDMYSLGATLYHMLTGKLPFAGSSLVETLKKQLSESLPDPRDDRPEISDECTFLLEIMLAKNRADRHADYQALHFDIARVKQGQMPNSDALQPGASVLMRMEGPRGKKAASGKPRKKTGQPITRRAADIVLGLAVILALAIVWHHETHRTEKADTPAAILPGTSAVTAVTARESAATAGAATRPGDAMRARLESKCREALEYAERNSNDFTRAHAALTSLQSAIRGTEWEATISAKLKQIEETRRQHIQQAMAVLRADLQQLVAHSNFDGAIARIEGDSSPVTEETIAAKAVMARAVNARKQDAEENQARLVAAANAKLSLIAQASADALLKGDRNTLTKLIREARSDVELSPVADQALALVALAQEAAGWPGKVASSFEANRGKSVTVEFKSGRTEEVLVENVSGLTVSGQRQVSAGRIGRSFTIDELSAHEKLKRLGDSPEPSVRVMRGLVQVQAANDWPAAAQELRECGLLGEALLRRAPGERAQPGKAAPKPPAAPAAAAPDEPVKNREREARQALQQILKLAGVSEDLSNVPAVTHSIRRKEFTYYSKARINAALAAFNANYSQTETARKHVPIIHALADAIGAPEHKFYRLQWPRGW